MVGGGWCSVEVVVVKRKKAKKEKEKKRKAKKKVGNNTKFDSPLDSSSLRNPVLTLRRVGPYFHCGVSPL